MLTVNQDLAIPEPELDYLTSRSSGPGGQNVNKVETRVTVLFAVDRSSVLDDSQKALVHDRLATRINKEGVLRVVSQKHRTQAANRDTARLKLAELLAEALRRRRTRKRTKPTRQAERRRLEGKRHRGEVKQRRARVTES